MAQTFRSHIRNGRLRRKRRRRRIPTHISYTTFKPYGKHPRSEVPANHPASHVRRPAKRRSQAGWRNGRGFALPGQNYAGPFNTNFNLKKRNRLDVWAMEHDLAYGRSKTNPYFKWIEADEQLLQRVQRNPRTLNEYITLGAFGLKKRLLNKKSH